MLNSPPFVLQRTGLVILFYNFGVFLPSITEDLVTQSSRIIGKFNLDLPSLPLIYPHSTGIFWIMLVFLYRLMVLIKVCNFS